MELAKPEHAHAQPADPDVAAAGHEGEDTDEQISSGFTQGGAIPAVAEHASAHPAAPSASERAYGSAVVTARRGLRVRSAPNLRAPVIDSLRNGQQVQQMNRVGDWVQIAHGAQTAFVHGDYLRATSGSTLDDQPRSAASSSSSSTVQQAPVQQAPVQHAAIHQAPVAHTAQAHVQQAPASTSARTQQSASERAFGAQGQATAIATERFHRGVRIIAPAGTHAGAIDRMAAVIDLEIGQNEYAQQHMQSSHVAVVIIPAHTQMTDLPQFASLRGQRTFDGRDWSRVRGSGGTRTADGTFAVGIAEESLVNLPGVSTGYNQEQVAQHEFSHIVHGQGMTPAQQARVRQLFDNMKRSDTNRDTSEFSDHYAASNVYEYFAQSTNVFFGTNAGIDAYEAGRQRANGRDWLRVNDPGMYAFLVDFYERAHDRNGQTVARPAAHS